MFSALKDLLCRSGALKVRENQIFLVSRPILTLASTCQLSTFLHAT